ncbi:hypothetical protein EOM09_08945, partial [bacterium]|nr:hypothetical protein [bacterium]
MIKKLVNLQLKFSVFIISLFFFISGFFLFFAMDLSQDPSFSALVSSDSVYNTNDRIIANTFGNKEAFIIFFKSDENTKLLDRPLLMNDEKASMCCTDPPYILDYLKGKTRNGKPTVGFGAKKNRRYLETDVLPDNFTALWM